MAGILQTLTGIVTSFSSMIATWISVIFDEGNEILALFALLPLVGIGIGFLKRLIRVD